MIDFEILLIDKNNVAESCYLDEPEVNKIVKNFNNSCWDLYVWLKGSRFCNDFLLALFSYFVLSKEIEQDILMDRFEIGCYIYDVKGNTYTRFFIRN